MQEIFARIEKKYRLTNAQALQIKNDLVPYVLSDTHFISNVQSIYYDDDSFQLIRRSIEKPYYKEKLRIRSYESPDEQSKVFVELKKKLDGVVYKRRTQANYQQVLNDIDHCSFDNEQIGNEIRYALSLYGQLKPKVYIASLRTSYRGKEDSELRFTFDEKMRYRFKNLALHDDKTDKPIDECVIMEIKTNGAMPLWLVNILNKNNAVPSPFSKVGTAYMNELKERKQL